MRWIAVERVLSMAAAVLLLPSLTYDATGAVLRSTGEVTDWNPVLTGGDEVFGTDPKSQMAVR